jgi:DNA-binding CsgD family transcriptional regulator
MDGGGPGAFIGSLTVDGRRLVITPRLGVEVVEEWLDQAFGLFAPPASARHAESETFLVRHSRKRRRHRVRVSPARKLLAAWFDHGSGSRLPARVTEWLASPSRDLPLRVEGKGRRLVVEAPTRGALLVSEKRAQPALTRRELEVLRAVAAGKSTAEIAHELYVTPATVSKHLEHVYRKLGVPSRTAALAAIGARVDALR